MTWLLDIFGSGAFGSIIGGVFGYLTKREERANMAMKFSHEVNMVKSKTEASIAIAKMSVEESKALGALAIDKEEAAGFKESLKVTSGPAEILKSLIRPAILGVLMWQTWEIHQTLEILTGGIQNMSPTEVMGLYKIIILTITGLTATAVGWYFAQRSSKQFDTLVNRWYK